MKRLLIVTVSTLLGVAALSAPASAAPPRCLPVPDLDGHVWTLCLPAR